jgi:hypothetical protein
MTGHYWSKPRAPSAKRRAPSETSHTHFHMRKLPSFKSIRTAKAYEALLKALYAGVKRQVDEVEIPPIQAIAVTGNQSPASKQYQEAIAVLYGIAYSLRMGLKFSKLPRPAGYFDYKVGALETLWWSEHGEVDITDATTLRWQAYLMVPAFVTKGLVSEARKIASEKHPEVPYKLGTLVSMNEGLSVQVLKVGPYDKERPTIDALHAYAADHGLVVKGKHHEIYLSDPHRTPAAKLKTVIRLAVRRGRAGH